MLARLLNRSTPKLVGNYGIRAFGTTYFRITHEWVDVDGKVAKVGISDFAQSALGEVVYVGLPEVGDEVNVGDPFASVESVKAASDVYAPVTGTIKEVNGDLTDSPNLVNDSPMEKGWFATIELSDTNQVEELASSTEEGLLLMKEDAYKNQLEKE